jgi:hypothetical protein
VPAVRRKKHRVRTLNEAEKQKFLQTHISGRIKLVELALGRMGTGSANFSYYHFTVAAVHARVLAQFLGLRLSKMGTLTRDTEYYPHEADDSYEVKLSDVCDKRLIGPNAFTAKDRRALEIGFDTINREVAHFTSFDSTPRHHSADTTTDYYTNLVNRLNKFCEIILRETRRNVFGT